MATNVQQQDDPPAPGVLEESSDDDSQESTSSEEESDSTIPRLLDESDDESSFIHNTSAAQDNYWNSGKVTFSDEQELKLNSCPENICFTIPSVFDTQRIRQFLLKAALTSRIQTYHIFPNTPRQHFHISPDFCKVARASPSESIVEW